VNGMYFNFVDHSAESWWGRNQFSNTWWRINHNDPHWAPPYFPAFRRALDASRNPHLARCQHDLYSLTASRKSSRKTSQGNQINQDILLGISMDVSTGAAVFIKDPRQADGSARAAWLHSINDRESFERLLDLALENGRQFGARRLLAPTGLSAHLGSGLLVDRWNTPPPLHSAYNPPYLPELLHSEMQLLETSNLYRLDITAENTDEPSHAPARVEPFNSARLSEDLLPLFAAACAGWDSFPTPDPVEARFILDQISPWPVYALLACVEDRPAGFVLLQPDLAPRLKRADGGRRLLWRLWLQVSKNRPVSQGRLLFAAVLPEMRGQGIGRQLLKLAMRIGRRNGWQSLVLGPLKDDSPATHLLQTYSAQEFGTLQLLQYSL
jgi:GNAT superfamily N-acetyltransferase